MLSDVVDALVRSWRRRCLARPGAIRILSPSLLRSGQWRHETLTAVEHGARSSK